MTRTLAGFALASLFAMRAALAGETGMSHDDTVNPGARAPHIVPPGAGASPKPFSTNTTPRPGTASPPQSGRPLREVQPGEETPQAEDLTRGTTAPKIGARGLQPGGGDGTQTEDELYVGRKRGALGTRGRNSGDEDDIDDLEIERRTVQGVETPGVPGKGPNARIDGRRGGLVAPRRDGRAAQDAASQGAPGSPALTRPGPNCGTHWTSWTEDPATNVNPCPPGCSRGERQLVKTFRQGDKLLYDARYQCHGTAMRERRP